MQLLVQQKKLLPYFLLHFLPLFTSSLCALEKSESLEWGFPTWHEGMSPCLLVPKQLC